MKGTLVDSNVLLDVLTEDPQWGEWSSAALEHCANSGPLFINAIIYAEVSVGFETIEAFEEALPPDSFARLHLPLEAAFLAGKAFLRYRRRKGIRTAPLPDLLIGAHAAVAGIRLLTRDDRFYRTYSPSLELVAPSTR